jgi:hypothetical protein
MPRVPIIACAALLACNAREAAEAPATAERPAAATTVRATPPTDRDVIDALLRHRDVKPTHASCRGVTGIAGDETLGHYVAHLIAQLAAAHAENTPAKLTAACDAGGSEDVFRCRFVVHVQAEDPWQYGVHFDLHADGSVPVSSIECPGAA